MIGSELPKGWKLVPLKEITSIIRGVSYPKEEAKLHPEENYVHILRGGNIQDGKIVFETDDNVYVNSSLVGEEQFVLKDDVVIVASTGSKKVIGKAATIEEDSRCISFGAFLLLLRTNVIDKRFHSYFFQTQYYRNTISSLAGGININNIKKEHIENLQIPLPPLTEQKQIAEKLDKLFDQIETIKEASNKIPELLKNFRQQVLTYAVTGKLTNSDFAHWEKSTIGAIGKVKGGKRLPKGEELVNYNTGYPYIRARDLKEGTVLKQNIMYLLPETQEKIKNYIVKTNDVYITIVGAKIGDAGIIPESMNNANLTENAAKITDLSEKIMPQYLSLWLQAPLCQSEIQQSIKSAAQGKLALTRINSLSVCFPPIESQKEIIDKVEYLLGELKIIESKFYLLQDILEKLPQALLRKAFKGELIL